MVDRPLRGVSDDCIASHVLDALSPAYHGESLVPISACSPLQQVSALVPVSTWCKEGVSTIAMHEPELLSTFRPSHIHCSG